MAGRRARAAPAVASGAPSVAEPQIRIRMYRIGFGDCFLVTLPGDGRTDHLLIDCGVHSQGDIGTLDHVVQDIVQVTGRKLALIIASHAHQDHISGFARHFETFSTFEAEAVWLPWSENPVDPLAQSLSGHHVALAGLLEGHFAARPPVSAAERAALLAVQNLSGNAKALSLLKNGLKRGRPTYVQAGDITQGAGGVPGLNVRFLGPTRDPKFLSRMDPPASERFLRMDGAGGAVAENAIQPFAAKWEVGADATPEYRALSARPKELAHLREAASDLSDLAFALDQAVNNTSVVALFTFRGRKLLFPGDSQYGGWQSWLQDASLAGELADIDFYKVAHHGSENATPKSALAAMASGRFAAMASTQSAPWPSIPDPKLEAALRAKANGVAWSDMLPVDGAPAGARGPLPAAFQPGPFWVDYLLPVLSA